MEKVSFFQGRKQFRAVNEYDLLAQSSWTTGSPSSIYEQLFIWFRDSSDLHIYKDLYGKNNDFFCNLWKCSDLKKSSYFSSLLCGLSRFSAILLVLIRETGLLSLYILPKVGYSDEAVDPTHWRKTAVNSLQQVQSPRNSG